MIAAANLSIRTKLAAGFGTALALIVAVGLFGVLQLHNVSAVTEELRAGWLPRIQLLGDIKRAAGEYRLLAARRIQTTDYRQLAEIARDLRAMEQDLRAAQDAYRNLAGLAEERHLFGEFEALWGDYKRALAEVHKDLEAGLIEPALRGFETTVEATADEATGKLDELLAYSKQRSEEAAAHAREIYGLALYLALLVIALAAIAAGAAIVWVTRNVTRPILRVSGAMRRLAAGDYAVEVGEDANRTDEVGTLVAAVAGYRDSLVRSLQLAAEADLEWRRLQAAVGNMPIGLSMFDAERRLIICNSCYAEMYGLPAELTRAGTPLSVILDTRRGSNFYASRDPDQYAAEIRELLEAGEARTMLHEFNDGRIFSIRYKPMDGGGWVATHEDVTERRQAEQRISHMARHDALTDLPNRIQFRERVAEALKRVKRGETIAVLCLDLDHFKSVNDTLGHPVGDQLLRSVAERLGGAVRDVDTVARLGGDEFAIVQVGMAQPEQSTALAQRVIAALSRPYELDGHQVVIGASVGIAVAPTDGEDPNQLLKNADMALYRAKADGRGNHRYFEPEMDARMRARRTLELDLRRALAQQEFELYYQPLINLKTEATTGFEALLRWRHPQRGIVLPNEFIPLAEEIGLIVPLGEWTLKQACLDAATWPDDLSVAVNLSPVQFRSKKVLESVTAALAVSHLPPTRLELEITESVLLIDNETTLATLHELRALGVRISMDDFGTGYSSLSYLRSFPFDKIKIDHTFIRGLTEENSSLAIVRAVTGLSASLGITTTAEGVETPEQLERVHAEGCTEVQGFLFSAPVPASEVGSMLESRRRHRVEAPA